MESAIRVIIGGILSLAAIAHGEPVTNRAPAAARAATERAPLQLAIWPPVQLIDRAGEITGLRLSIPLGQNRSMYGLDLGVLATMTGMEDAPGAVKGVQYATGANDVNGSVTGLQLAGLINRVTGPFAGIQLASLVNEVQETFSGVQIGVGINRARKTLTGLQLALFNVQEEETKGVQLGAINTTGGGWQFGILNYNRRGVLPWMGIFNVSYRPREPEPAEREPAPRKEFSISSSELQAGPEKGAER